MFVGTFCPREKNPRGCKPPQTPCSGGSENVRDSDCGSSPVAHVYLVQVNQGLPQPKRKLMPATLSWLMTGYKSAPLQEIWSKTLACAKP